MCIRDRLKGLPTDVARSLTPLLLVELTFLGLNPRTVPRRLCVIREERSWSLYNDCIDSWILSEPPCDSCAGSCLSWNYETRGTPYLKAILNKRVSSFDLSRLLQIAKECPSSRGIKNKALRFQHSLPHLQTTAHFSARSEVTWRIVGETLSRKNLFFTLSNGEKSV